MIFFLSMSRLPPTGITLLALIKVSKRSTTFIISIMSPFSDRLIRGDRQAKFVIDCFCYVGRHHVGDIPTQQGHFLEEAGTNEHIVLRGHEGDHIHVWGQSAVHKRHLKLVLEIRTAAQAPYNNRSADLLGKTYYQS